MEEKMKRSEIKKRWRKGGRREMKKITNIKYNDERGGGKKQKIRKEESQKKEEGET